MAHLAWLSNFDMSKFIGEEREREKPIPVRFLAKMNEEESFHSNPDEISIF